MGKRKVASALSSASSSEPSSNQAITSSQTSTTTTNTQKNNDSPSSASVIAKQVKSLLKQCQEHARDHSTSQSLISEAQDAKALDQLRHIFARLHTSGDFTLPSSSSSSSSSSLSNSKQKSTQTNSVKDKWNTWLRKHHSLFVQQLSHRVQLGRKSALRTFMGVIASSPTIHNTRFHPQSKNYNDNKGNGKDTPGKSSEAEDQGNNKSYQGIYDPYMISLAKALSNQITAPHTTSSNQSVTSQTFNSMNIMNEGVLSEQLLEMLQKEFLVYTDAQYSFMIAVESVASELVEIHERHSKRVTDDKGDVHQKSNKDDDSDDVSQDDVDSDHNSAGDNEDEEILHEVSIQGENLLRIMSKIDIASSQKDLNPKDVKVDKSVHTQSVYTGLYAGTSSNYLFLPPYIPTESDDDSEDDDSEDEEEDETKFSGYENDDKNYKITNLKDESSSDEEDDEDDDDDSDDEPSMKKRKITKSSNNQSTTPNKIKRAPCQSIFKHRVALEQSHLKLFELPSLPLRSFKRVLTRLPYILSNVNEPLRFADFCIRAYEMQDSTASILALDSVFILMTEHDLEYPDFYTSLYQLISPKIFHSNHRRKFCTLLHKCLMGNQMMPAYLIAACCKKLMRCALSIPPASILFIVALVSNLLRKHSECSCLIHREVSGTKNKSRAILGPMESGDATDDGDATSHGAGEDPFDMKSNDPLKSRALESSLWELNALERHYHPAVSAMARQVGKEGDDVLMHDMNDFVVHTYKSLFDQERKREKKYGKKNVPLTFVEPKGLFVEGDVFDGIFDFGSTTNKEDKGVEEDASSASEFEEED